MTVSNWRNILGLVMVGLLLVAAGVAAVSWGWNERGPARQSEGQLTAGQRPARGATEASGAGQATASMLEDRPPVPVMLTQATRRVFEEKLKISGTVLAKRFALVSARIPGTLDQVFVDAGDVVEAGKTKLFQTDALKLQQAVAIAQQQVAVAECALKEKYALLEKTRVARDQAFADLERYRQLRQQNAIAQQVVEHQQAQCRQLEADIRHIETLIDLAKAQLEQARLNLRIAEKDLADSLVVAPISGRVSLRLKEPGEMAGAGTPVLRIEDGSLVEISVFVPAEYYDRVEEGKTKLRVRVGQTLLRDLAVTYKSPTVEPRLRTFQVKALVESPPPEVVPGALAQVEVILQVRTGIGVPTQAVVQRSGADVVFTVHEYRARALPVQLGLEMDGWREVLSGLDEGTPIVSMGQSMLDDGVRVRLLEEKVEQKKQ
ncbi:MAG: efflux RND transporter periplasmic adaptor subunit [Thermoguttaceae bacterium]|nr:efflux RND transporter periplasmic adaptor subunit [Thermoguttaceae bacterium]MDW8037914.1 efflux RND transporter periplasmic adaptor subunit [Thermoguttaceae bacterium]